jgi:SAM-dependent methyltransferase
VVVARDTLDYVDDPERALAELQRILRPRGTLIVLFDVGHIPNESQPNALTISGIRAGLRPDMTVTYEHEWDEPFGHDGHRVVLVAERGPED